jgi:VanZ like family
MRDPKSPPGISSRGPRRGTSFLAVVVWCGLIFGTSCTVVTAQGLYAWIAAHADAETFRKFALLWGLSWFAIVKGWHAAEYAILFWFIKAALDRIATTHQRRNILLSLVFCLLFAISDEYHQTFVPGRNGTWTDVVIDGLGACLAALISILREGQKGGRMFRGIFKRVALAASLLTIATSVGCGSKSAEPIVYQFETNDYKIEYDGEQKRTTIGPGLMRMVRHPEDIEVSDGELRVGPRNYGAVARHDKISVVGDKVAVNGQERRPSTP